jgi:hypothetical protein
LAEHLKEEALLLMLGKQALTVIPDGRKGQQQIKINTRTVEKS